MTVSPVKFLFGFLLVSIVLWLLFISANRLIARILGRLAKATIEFRLGGWKCLREVVVKFEKGPVASVSVGEVRLSLRRSLLNLGFGCAYRDSKLQILISDLEVVMRHSGKSAQKVRSRKASNSGRGKWMVLANMARFLSVSVTELNFKTPKVSMEIKELKVDISKNGASKPTLLVKLDALPVLILLEESRHGLDQTCNYNTLGNHVSLMGKSSSPFSCEVVSLSCEFGHDSEVGVVIKFLDIICGEVYINVNEEVLQRKNSSPDILTSAADLGSFDVAKNLRKKQQALAAVTKYTLMFPEKVCFSLPALDVRYLHKEHNLTVENKITGIQLKCIKSKSTEDVGDTTRFDVQMEFSEIHLAREGGTSILEILKVDILSFVYVPSQTASPVRAEIDIKMGGTQCNLLMSRLKPWINIWLLKSKTSVHHDFKVKKPQASGAKVILWTCTASAPEMTIILYSLSGVPLYHGCSQSSHVYANNISVTGTSIHTEFGEINLHLADEYQEYAKECLFGVETNSGSLMHIAKISLDWGRKDVESPDEDVDGSWLALSVDVTGMGIYFTAERVQCLVSSALSFQSFFQSILVSKKNLIQKRDQRILKRSGKGTQLLKFNLERCTVKFHGETCIESTVITDPKRVNYGSQGGKVVIKVSADGTERNAEIISRIPEELKKLKYSVSLDIFHFNLCTNKDKKSSQVDLERARFVYQEYMDNHKPGTKLSLFDIQNAKFVRRAGGLKEIAVCSLFSATDITVRWEPEVHLCLFELYLRLKLLVHNEKQHGLANEHNNKSMNSVETDARESITESQKSDKNHKKKESVFAVDIEMLRVFAEVGDGIDAVVQIQSIFSENAHIGILLEGFLLSFNGSRVFKSSRMQISRVPSMQARSSHGKLLHVTTWDWVIQGLDVHIYMPYRIQLRAIEDSIEDMLRSLKLICSAKSSLLFPVKKQTTKPKMSNPLMLGCVRLCIRKLTAAIEEEPIQGWLDEHYHLLKNEANELAVRLKFLDDAILKVNQCAGTSETNDSIQGRKVHFDGAEIDMLDSSAVKKLREHIYKQSFHSYYKACQKSSVSEGSGASNGSFQSGFKPSNNRAHLLSISVSDLDASFTQIDGGEAGMIELIHKLDPVSLQNSIPFSRLYGSNVLLHTGILVVQLRDYTFPIFSGTSGRCKGSIILAQQATSFQPQVHHDVFIGRWWKVRMLRSASGTTPPMKTYLDLPLSFQNADLAFGVGFEPAFADISYAFTVALRRANLSVKGATNKPPALKKERSLPWWDDIRYYVHGNITLVFAETRWNILATTDPYEKLDKLQISSGQMEILQSDGRVHVTAKEFKMQVSSLESLMNNHTLKIPMSRDSAFLEAPDFTLEVIMEWECESANPLNHYLHALPIEGKLRDKVYDPFRSTSLSLGWNFSLMPSQSSYEKFSSSSVVGVSSVRNHHAFSPLNGPSPDLTSVPTMNMGAHDLAWLIKFWNMNYNPPHKLRSFSRWPRFGIPRAVRSGNLSLDKVMTEFMLRIDSTPSCIKHRPLDDDDPAKGLTFNMTKLKYELCYSRGKQKYTFDCRRDSLDLVYRGLDLHMPIVCLNKADCPSSTEVGQKTEKFPRSSSVERSSNKRTYFSGCTERHCDNGFLLSSDYFTIRRQAPKADPSRLIAWQEAGRNLEMTYVRSEFENGSDSDERARSEPSDDDGYNVVIADNCQRIFVYGLKLLWTIENRDAVWSWVGGISKAFEPPKPSASRQYSQRKSVEEDKKLDGNVKCLDDSNKPYAGHTPASSSSKLTDSTGLHSSSPCLVRMEDPSAILAMNKDNINESDEEGTRHFMVNVVEPQFNLHSEEANGRFLLAAVSGRVLARSFDSLVRVGLEVIEHALGARNARVPEYKPELAWKRMEFSVMLEHVQAHVAPTDVDPGAGLQWLPKILRSSPKVKRTGALLERVFMPCDMYFQYTRHKGGTADLKMKPLKQLRFNSHNITATMTSRQFQVMLDVLTNLLFARLPKPRKSSLSYPTEDHDDDVGEEADEVVPEGVKEVELAKVNLEHKEQQHRLLLSDIRKLSVMEDVCTEQNMKDETDLWMVNGGRNILVKRLKKELENAQKSRKGASLALRKALQKAAQLRLMEKEKNKSPSYAMQISLQINKVVWGMLVDGKPFAEAEINDLRYDFNRDYNDVGVARFTTKFFVVRNCLPNPKSSMVLSAWNPPPEWGKKVMLHVDAQQGAPNDGTSHLERFQVEIYPLKIHLTETMYRMMWEYFFPEEEQDSQQRQEVWKVSTTAGSKRVKKSLSIHEASISNTTIMKESDIMPKSSASMVYTNTGAGVSLANSSFAHGSNVQNPKANYALGSVPEAPSFGKALEENVLESTADEFIFQTPSLGEISGLTDQSAESSKYKLKEVKQMKSGRSSHEEKKNGKVPEEKRSRPRKLMEFHNIKISQVELLLTYEGSRFVVNDLKLLMDTFHRVEFTGTWRRLFSRVKKHIIWGVLKSVTGMQGKKFKDKDHGQKEIGGVGIPDSDHILSDNESQPGTSGQYPASWMRRPSEGAGDGFVTSIRGLFNTQRRRAKAFVLRTMRGEAENEFQGEWSESDGEYPFARQLTITKRLIRRHTKKFRSRGTKGSSSQQRGSLPSSPRETTPIDSDSSSEPYKDFNDEIHDVAVTPPTLRGKYKTDGLL
ncbi:hypothetical protein QQ045_020586 [Rhodiola kirilowii]